MTPVIDPAYVLRFSFAVGLGVSVGLTPGVLVVWALEWIAQRGYP